jgi:hypothetical protein
LLPLTTIGICWSFRVILFAVGMRGQNLGKPAGADLGRMPGELGGAADGLVF